MDTTHTDLDPEELEERFIALETKVAFQERLLQELNEVLIEQSARLEDFTVRLQRAEAALGDLVRDRPPHERPPHY